MNLKTITFPAGGYCKERSIYAFVFSNSSIYIGITGTSNNTGVSAPYQRLATHLRKHGKTYSIIHSNQCEFFRDDGFRFSYCSLPSHLQSQAQKIEDASCDILRAGGHVVLNTNHGATSSSEPSALAWANNFASAIAQLARTTQPS